jgi:hypothetical protein
MRGGCYVVVEKDILRQMFGQNPVRYRSPEEWGGFVGEEGEATHTLFLPSHAGLKLPTSDSLPVLKLPTEEAGPAAGRECGEDHTRWMAARPKQQFKVKEACHEKLGRNSCLNSCRIGSWDTSNLVS